MGSEGIVARCARPIDVAASAFNRLKVDFQVIVELLYAADQWAPVYADSPETFGTSSSISMVPGNDGVAGQSCISVIKNFCL